MKLLIFIVVGIIAGLLLLAGIMALIGSRLPKAHVASAERDQVCRCDRLEPGIADVA